MLALDLFWDDNVTIIPDSEIESEVYLDDAELQVKQLFKLYESGVHTNVKNTLRLTCC